MKHPAPFPGRGAGDVTDEQGEPDPAVQALGANVHAGLEGTSLLVINAYGVLDTDRAPLVRILRDYAGTEPTIAISSSSGLRPGFASATTLDRGALTPDNVACALATLNVVAGWDESETIVARIMRRSS